MNLAMLIFGVLTVLSALGVVCSKKTLYSALWLVVTFFLVAIHYGLLGAHFLATLQILVYAGAIMVLVVFVILLLGLNEKANEPKALKFPLFLTALLVGAFVGILLVGVLPIATGSSGTYVAHVTPELAGVVLTGTPKEVGIALFGKFLFPFEIVSVLLLAGVIGAVVLAYEPRRRLGPGRGLRAKQEEYGQEGSEA